MSTDGILNIVKREVARQLSLQGKPLMGIVDSYDPQLYCAKVRLQPENPDNPEHSLTGFLPIATEWVGNGWGLVCPPSAGDVVDVHFQEDGKNAGYVSKRFYSSVTLPPMVDGAGAPSGEFWLVHQSGSFLKFTNDGKVSVNSNSDMDFNSGGDVNVTAAGKINLDAGTEAILRGGTVAIVDADGTGVKYQPALVSTFTDGVPATHSGPTPPAVT
jgi:hypothetical protein